MTQTFPFILVRSKRKTLSIQIKPTGEIFVRVPNRVSENQINRFLSNKSAWVHKHLAKFKALKEKSLTHKGFALFLGQQYKVEFVDNIKKIKLSENQILIPLQFKPKLEPKLTSWYKKHAKEYITERAVYLASLYGFKFNRIKITSATTRWGSCSGKNNINFTYRLVMLEKAVIDYVIIHELCHTKEHNHSDRFWRLVESILPTYKEQERYLKSVNIRIDLNLI